MSRPARLIRRVWVRIAALLAIAIIPTMALQMKLQGDSLALLFELAGKASMRTAVDDYLVFLREEARRDPSRAAELKARFVGVTETKRALEEFFLAREPLTTDITKQTIMITAAVLTLSLAASVAVSRQVVDQVRALLAEREAAAAKLRDLATLERWQTIARTLVHELRAPLTPLKLIATDIEQKYANLPPATFAAYLGESQRLAREQLSGIETMIASFTAFGRLPKAQRQPVALDRFLKDFTDGYGHALGPAVALTCHSPDDLGREVSMDAKLMRDLLFNLCKNAAEANPDRPLRLTLRAACVAGRVELTLHNDGRPVPPELAGRIFDPYVSTHHAVQGGANMGLGLTIARKIALDHGGDLTLAQNDADGVTFRCEFPAVPEDVT